MSTSNLSQTAPLVVAPSLTPWPSWVSGALHRVQTLLIPVLSSHEPSEQTYHQISLHATSLRFSGKSIYTPHRDWNGYR